MAVRGDRYFADTWDLFIERANELSILFRHAVADCIRNIDGSRARRDRGFDYLTEKGDIGSRRIFGRKFHIGAQ